MKKVSDLYKNTNTYDKLVLVGDLEQHRLNHIAYPPNNKELKDLAVMIHNSGLIDPIEVNKVDKKIIWSGHRRFRTLISEFNVTEVPVKYVNVPDFDNDLDELTYLVERNVKREEKFIDTYKYLKYYFTTYKKDYQMELSNDAKEYQCKLKNISLDLYKKAQEIEYSGRSDLWKKVEKGNAVTTVWKELKNRLKDKDRHMNPSINLYFEKNRDVLIEALSETATYMYSLVHQERKDLEKNDGSTHKPFLGYQTNIIGSFTHEDFTKNVAAILRRNGKDVEALNEGLADLTSLTEKWDIETKTALFDGTKLTFTSYIGWGAYYILLGYTHEYNRFFLALVKVPHKSWVFGKHRMCYLSTKELYRISQDKPNDYIQVLGGISKSKGRFHCYLDPIQ